MPAIVISDCSPIRALHHLNLLPLFQNLYGSVIVPDAVRRELLNPTKTCPSIRILDFPGFEVRTPQLNPLNYGIPSDLDPGETEAIAIAIELHATLVLMDERKGTEAARHLGLTTIGVFGVLLEAKRKGLIPKVIPFVDQLISGLGFFASPVLRQRIARLAGE